MSSAQSVTPSCLPRRSFPISNVLRAGICSIMSVSISGSRAATPTCALFAAIPSTMAPNFRGEHAMGRHDMRVSGWMIRRIEFCFTRNGRDNSAISHFQVLTCECLFRHYITSMTLRVGVLVPRKIRILSELHAMYPSLR
jgi:hypothetical protein